MSAAAIAERRFLQQQRCRILYRKALKSVLDWAVHRDIFYIEGEKTRLQFEANRDVVCATVFVMILLRSCGSILLAMAASWP
jgi:hypothetical protein